MGAALSDSQSPPPPRPLQPNQQVGLARASKAQRGAGSGSSSARGMQRHHSVAFATSTDEILLRRVSHTFRSPSNGSGIAGGGEKRTRDADDLVMVRKLFGALA